MGDEMVEASRFWDKMAERYVASPIADVPTYERKLEITRGYLRPDMELLEVGCGSGATARLHAPYVKHILATDFSSRMIDLARAKSAEEGVTNVTYEVADVNTLDRPGSFDMVLALSVLHLMEDRDATIRAIHGLLKPGGLFVSSTACIGDFAGIFRVIGPIGRALGLLPILNVMTHQELVASMEGAGFTIEHDWRPSKGKAVFIVARKTAE